MNIALVHDWIVAAGGAERVLSELHTLFPEAPIYTLLHNPVLSRDLFPHATILPSSLQKIPLAWKLLGRLGPAMPSAIESFDLSAYDVVISSSPIFAKGLIVRPSTRHLCYCYSPARMLWDRHAIYERTGVLAKLWMHNLRMWDFYAAQRPDVMMVPSTTSAQRVRKYYRRHSEVVHPPTRALRGRFAPLILEPYFLVVARLVPHKNIDVILSTFAKLKHRLIIVGSGPLRRSLTGKKSHNVTFLGSVDDAVLARLYTHCEALILANDEDWGLTAVEAMAYGKPVIALRKGGATESVQESRTGEFFDDPIPEALADAIVRFMSSRTLYVPEYIQQYAERYSSEQFEKRIRSFLTI